MYIEAFTTAKDPRRPETNEDRLVIVPGIAYAVVDGVTDKSGRLYEGRTGGRWAGELIERAVRGIVAREPFMTMPATRIADAVNAQFRAAYRLHRIEDRVRDDPNARFAAQLALVLCDARSYRFVLVGDCGVRLGGDTVHLARHPGDAITGGMRSIVYHAIAEDVGEDQRLLTARAYVLDGMAAFLPSEGAWIDEGAWSALRAQMLAELPGRFPDLPRAAVEEVVATGIKGLARYRNGTAPMAFASLDGTDVPAELLRDFTLPQADVHTIELFSDGYFAIPDGTTVRHWEDAFFRLEQEDPAKVKTVLSTKGSVGGAFTDDRSVLIIRREPSTHA
jgi:hypothetical protein